MAASDMEMFEAQEHIAALEAEAERLRDVVDAAPSLLDLVDEMSAFVGSMALRDYARFNEAPARMRSALAALDEEVEE